MTYKLYTDGSHVPHANTAGFGGYIEDETGSEVVRFSKTIDNPAYFRFFEISGIRHGLKEAIKLGIKDLAIYSDSLYDVRRLNGRPIKFEGREYNRKLENEVLLLMHNFTRVTIDHIPREKNTKADSISREAMLKKCALNRKKASLSANTSNSTDTRFSHPALFYAQMNPNSYRAQDLPRLKKEVNEYLIFDFSENNQKTLTVYQANKQELSCQFLAHVDVFSLADSLGYIATYLLHLKTDKPGIVIVGESKLLAVLNGKHTVEAADKPAFDKFMSSLDSFNTVLLDENKMLTKALQKKKQHIKASFRAIKKLGEAGLTESIIKNMVSLIKKDLATPESLQKHYFSVLVSDYMSTQSIKNAKDALIHVRQDLIEKGVKLRF